MSLIPLVTINNSATTLTLEASNSFVYADTSSFNVTLPLATADGIQFTLIRKDNSNNIVQIVSSGEPIYEYQGGTGPVYLYPRSTMKIYSLLNSWHVSLNTPNYGNGKPGNNGSKGDQGTIGPIGPTGPPGPSGSGSGISSFCSCGFGGTGTVSTTGDVVPINSFSLNIGGYTVGSGRITIPDTGYYRLDYMVKMDPSNSSTHSYSAILRKNAVVLPNSSCIAQTTTGVNVQVTLIGNDIVQLSAGDLVDIFAQGSAPNIAYGPVGLIGSANVASLKINRLS